MKQCRSCGETKPLSEFYKHSKMSDGRLNHCKVCVKDRVNQHRQDNLEKVRAYDRARLQPKRSKYPIQYKANGAVNRALKDGDLIRPSSCSCCGKICVPDGHHWSYDEKHWLDVIWLCRSCHGKEHERLRELGNCLEE